MEDVENKLEHHCIDLQNDDQTITSKQPIREAQESVVQNADSIKPILSLQSTVAQIARNWCSSRMLEETANQIVKNLSQVTTLQDTLAKNAVNLRSTMTKENILAQMVKNLRTGLTIQSNFNISIEAIRQSLQVWQQELAKSFKEIQKHIEAIGENTEKFKAIIVELGWPPHDSIDIVEVRNIVKAYQEYGAEGLRSEVEQYFLKKFGSEEIKKMLSNWEKTKWLKDRLPILKQAIEAHLEGNYYISVPALLPQIEGIIADGYGHFGYMGGEKLEKYIKKLLSNKNTFSFDIAVQEFLLQYVLAEFQHGLSPKSFLSRHAILHGADTNYGTAANSLKCILLFDYLQDKFGFVSVGKGKSYHLISCPVVLKYRIRVGNEDWIMYKDRYEARLAGKIPCKICKP